jgi:hypothetical protein
MNNSKIELWLKTIGKLFSIKNVYNTWRPDDSLHTVKDYFTYEIISSEPIDKFVISDLSTVALVTTNKLNKMWRTIVKISCSGDRGQYVLQALEATKDLQEIKNIFGEMVKNIGCDQITSDPWIDESTKEYKFTTQFTFNEDVEFTLEFKDGIVKELEVTGRAISADGYAIFDTCVIEK